MKATVVQRVKETVKIQTTLVQQCRERLVKWFVKEGDEVKKGDSMAITEAMKNGNDSLGAV